MEAGHVWCAFSPAIRGRACATQASDSINECRQLKQRFNVGQPVQVSCLPVPHRLCRLNARRPAATSWPLPRGFLLQCQPHALATSPAAPDVQATVLAVDSRRRALDVTLLPQQQGAAALRPPARGSTLLGRITSVGGAGVRVQLGARSSGRVALTDIHDGPVPQALAGLEAGQYVQAAVLGPDVVAASTKSKGKGGSGTDGGASQLLLSLRPADGGSCAAHAAAAKAEQQQGGGETPPPAAGELQTAQLKPGQKVCTSPVGASLAGNVAGTRPLHCPSPHLRTCCSAACTSATINCLPCHPCAHAPRRWLGT